MKNNCLIDHAICKANIKKKVLDNKDEKSYIGSTE